MIVGTGFDSDEGIVFPHFGFYNEQMVDEGYYFYFKCESGVTKPMEKLDYKEFLEWLPDGDFKEDTLRLKDQSFNGITTQLIFHGCKESKEEFEIIMNKYYERNHS
jgi:hypothetical protein